MLVKDRHHALEEVGARDHQQAAVAQELTCAA